MVQPLTYTNDASDVTAHVPKYVPKNLFKLASSNLDDVVVALSLDERNAIYVYKYYWASPEEKAQSSWSKFTIDSSGVILNADFIDTKLYLVIGRSDGMYLEYLDFQPAADGLGFLVHLDQRVSSTGTYSAVTNKTTWTLPYPVTDGTWKAVLGSAYTGQAGTVLNLTVETTNTVSVTGNYGSPVFIGRPYVLEYTFSPIYYKDEAKVAVPHYNLKLKNFEILYSQTGYFGVTVTPKNRDVYEYTFRDSGSYTYTGKQLGDTTMKIGTVTIATGKYRFPVFSDALTTVITITSDSPLPCSLQAAEWEGLLATRSKHL